MADDSKKTICCEDIVILKEKSNNFKWFMGVVGSVCLVLFTVTYNKMNNISEAVHSIDKRTVLIAERAKAYEMKLDDHIRNANE